MSNGKTNPTIVSRRTLIGAAAAAPVLANAGGLALADDLVTRCVAFLAVDMKIERLTARWGALESDAAEHHRWFFLSAEERLALPQSREMAQIDEILEGLFRRREELLEELPEAVATDPTGVAAKVAVAAKAVHPDDNALIHQLLDGAARDMADLRCPDCHRPLVMEDWIAWSVASGRGELG